MTDYQAVIVGGGLAGASMAVSLGAIGMSCALIEAAPPGGSRQPSFDDRALALSEGSRRIYQTLGVWPRLPDNRVTPIEHIHVSDRGHGGFTRLHARQAGVAALGQVVIARDLGAALTECLSDNGNNVQRIEAVVTSVTADDAAAHVEIDDTDGTRRIGANLVILADGGRSGLAQQCGIAVRTQLYDQIAVLANVHSDRSHGNIAYERFTRTGPLALLPMPERRFKVVWTVHPDELERVLQLSNQAFVEELQARFGRRAGRFSQPGARSHYPMLHTRVDRPWARRVALIGNAAHITHPIAGQGFNLGLRDIAALAELLADAWRTGGDVGEAGLLRRYAAQRAADVRGITGFTDLLVGLFANGFPPLALARNAGMVMLDRLPWLRASLLRRMMGLSGRQSRLMRGLPLGGQPD